MCVLAKLEINYTWEYQINSCSSSSQFSREHRKCPSSLYLCNQAYSLKIIQLSNLISFVLPGLCPIHSYTHSTARRLLVSSKVSLSFIVRFLRFTIMLLSSRYRNQTFYILWFFSYVFSRGYITTCIQTSIQNFFK